MTQIKYPVQSTQKITQTAILNDARLKLNGKKRSILTIKPANQWLVDASSKPQPEPLFKNIWFESEICIFFGDTGQGKTIFANQIGDEIARRKKVLYLDFELSEKQFEARYSDNYSSHYNFPENFYRAEINPDESDYIDAGYKSSEEFINASIEDAIKETDARILIVDNLTYLRCETEKAKEALPLMKHLKALKNEYNLSILVLAHTPKRNLALPITRNDLQGSKMLINFCDSAFAIGESAKDKSLRYLKQIKTRNAEIIHDADNVAVYEIKKQGNFLAFTFVHTTCEHEHLKQHTKEDKETIKQQIYDMIDKGKTYREISNYLGIGLGTISKYNCSRSFPESVNRMNE